MNCENCDWNNKRSSVIWKYPCGSDNDCPKVNFNENCIVKYQRLYYLGLGWGIATYCFEVYEKDGERWVMTNDRIHRKESEILENTGDLFTSKDAINQRLAKSYRAKLL